MSALIDNLNVRQVGGKDQSKIPEQAVPWVGSYAGTFLKDAAGFQREGNMSRSSQDAPRSADDCGTAACLEAWRAQQYSQIDHFVPQQYQKPAQKRIDESFSKNLERLRNSTAADMTSAERSQLAQAASADSEAKAKAKAP